MKKVVSLVHLMFVMFTWLSFVPSIQARELNHQQAREYLWTILFTLIKDDSKPVLQAKKVIAKRVIEERCRHFNWLNWSRYFLTEEVENTVLDEILTYIELTTYRVSRDQLGSQENAEPASLEISLTIRKELETIFKQVPFNLLRSGHISPFIGGGLLEKVKIRIKEKRLSQQSGKELANQNYKERENKGECAICLEKYSKEHQPVSLKCGHIFCKTCLHAQYKSEGGQKFKCAACYTHINTQEYLDVFHPELSSSSQQANTPYQPSAPPYYGS